MPLFGRDGPPDVEQLQRRQNLRGLIKALRYQQDFAVRSAAAQALGQLGGARAVEPLLEALGDPSAFVREAAAQALTRLNDTRAVEPLVAALTHADPRVR